MCFILHGFKDSHTAPVHFCQHATVPGAIQQKQICRCQFEANGSLCVVCLPQARCGGGMPRKVSLPLSDTRRRKRQILLDQHSTVCFAQVDTRWEHGSGSKPMVPFWARCTTHVRTYFSGDWDVHCGYDLDFDPWPHGAEWCSIAFCRHTFLGSLSAVLAAAPDLARSVMSTRDDLGLGMAI